MIRQLWAFIAVCAAFVTAKTYNDHAFVVWGRQGVELQKQQLLQEARIADALDRAFPLPVAAAKCATDVCREHAIEDSIFLGRGSR